MKYSRLPGDGLAIGKFISLRWLHLTLGIDDINLRFLPPNIEYLSVHLPDKVEGLNSVRRIDVMTFATVLYM